MKSKRIVASWRIAFAHWFLVGLILPLLTSIIVSITLRLLQVSFYISSASDLIVTPLVFWFGTIYSAYSINKSYVVSDNVEIARLSTYILLIVGGGGRVYSFLYGLFSSTYPATSYMIALNDIVFIFSAIIFYFASKKYIVINA